MTLKPNIGVKGRLFRLVIGFALLGAALLASHIPLLKWFLFISAAFVFFEAIRGWCLLRACGIRTKL